MVSGKLMAKYTSAEDLYSCTFCGIQFAAREAEEIESPWKNVAMYRCPKCQTSVWWPPVAGPLVLF